MSEPATTDEKPPADGEAPPPDTSSTKAAPSAATPSEAPGTDTASGAAPSEAPGADAPSADAPSQAPGTDAPSDAAPSEAPTTDAASGAAPVKKKKKKKKPVAAPKEELDAEGRERPSFVLAFPSDPDLDHAVKAFELGDYATVRTEATRLLEHPKKDVQAAAGELLARIEPDPLVKILLAMAVLLLFAVTFWAYRSHGVH
jgi:hypothetical protein